MIKTMKHNTSISIAMPKKQIMFPANFSEPDGNK